MIGQVLKTISQRAADLDRISSQWEVSVEY